jgi:hypothetical protein
MRQLAEWRVEVNFLLNLEFFQLNGFIVSVSGERGERQPPTAQPGGGGHPADG